MLNIIVCIKQVPDTANVRIDPTTNTLMREGLESIMNPFDAAALELALRTKDLYGAEVTVLTMGPPQAEAVLREALAVGADKAFLVSSRAFSGADTLATAYALQHAIETVSKGCKPDLILFGRQAIDGDTAQVGPEVSALLGLPLVPYVRELEVEASDNSFRSCLTMDDGQHAVEGSLPAVMTVGREGVELRFASLEGTMAAARAPVAHLTEIDIGADPSRLGLKGSATKVSKIFPPQARMSGRVVTWDGNTQEILDEIRR